MARKVIFLDRDGVLNREIGRHVWKPEEFEILPDVCAALQIWRDKGFDFVIVTNQSGIALNYYTHEELAFVHNILLAELRKAGIFVLEIFYSPHHPSISASLSRKPGGLLLEKAIAKYNIDANLSYMLGDRERDVEAAQAAGVKGILIESNSSLLALTNTI